MICGRCGNWHPWPEATCRDCDDEPGTCSRCGRCGDCCDCGLGSSGDPLLDSLSNDFDADELGIDTEDD